MHLTRNLRAALCALSALVLSLAPAGADQSGKSADYLGVVIDNSATFTMTSDVNGRTYQIFVAWPFGSPPAEGFPAIYMTDANAHFSTMVETSRSWSRGSGRGQQNAIIVGIGYPAGADIRSERAFDLTMQLGDAPTPEGFGAADAFLHFVLDELKPRIEASYPVDTNRQALFGHSFGGLFALHSLINQPDAFQTYLAASPSIWWGERFSLKESLPRLTPKLETSGATPRVFISVGEFEQSAEPGPRPPSNSGRQRPQLPGVADRTQVDDAEAMSKLLSKTPGVLSRYVLFDGEGHGSVAPAAMSRAISFFFDDAAPPPARAPAPARLSGETRRPVPTATEYVQMLPQARYELRIDVRSWPEEERRRFLKQLKYNLEAGLWYGEQHALHLERNAMDAKYGTRPVE